MDKKISELQELNDITGSEYIVVSVDDDNFKTTIKNIKDKPVVIDEDLSEISTNPVQNKTITVKCIELEEKIKQNSLEIDSIHFDFNTDQVETFTADPGTPAEVQIKDLGKDENNVKTLAFSFTIPKGDKGDKGEAGEVGEIGASTRTVFAFKHAKEKPTKPTGGSWNIESNSIIYPEGWSATDNLKHPIWMSNAAFDKNGIVQDWTSPVQITGEDGVNGTDGLSSEFVFKIFAKEQTNLNPPYSDPYVDDYQSDGWIDHPTGVSKMMPYEYMCIRYKNAETGLWGEFSTPALWSKYGVDGRDGDGVEYIYQVTVTQISPKTPGRIAASNSPTQNFQDHEFIPAASSGERPWTDNPTGVSNSTPYEWVSIRKFKSSEQEWGDFSSPVLWAHYGENGEDGIDGTDGEDGTGLTILGSYDSYEELEAAWKNGTLKGNNPPQVGDAYLIDGDLWIFDGDDFYNAGPIRGPQGQPGEDGSSMYIHIKYADYLDSSGNGVFTADNGETPGKYIGVRVDYIQSDSSNPADYTWSLFKGNDGFGYEYIFQRSTEFVAPNIPTEITASNVAPQGWTDDPTGVDVNTKYEWCCYRKSDADGNWGQWRGKKEDSTKAWLFAMYAESVGIPGDTGNPGPVLYPAGEWSGGTYSQTLNSSEIAIATPYVVYKNTHYVLMVESTSEEPGSGTDWLAMDNFSALYTDILLADRATVGNACFYGNYMFSQGGSGTFSQFDWTKDPYAEDQPFKPAWCVNLITGEMWSGTGTVYFADNGSGWVANKNIQWDENGNVTMDGQIGNAIEFSHANVNYRLGPKNEDNLGGFVLTSENNPIEEMAYIGGYSDNGAYNSSLMLSSKVDGKLNSINLNARASGQIAMDQYTSSGSMYSLELSPTQGIKFMDWSGSSVVNYSGITKTIQIKASDVNHNLEFYNGILVSYSTTPK